MLSIELKEKRKTLDVRTEGGHVDSCCDRAGC